MGVPCTAEEDVHHRYQPLSASSGASSGHKRTAPLASQPPIQALSSSKIIAQTRPSCAVTPRPHSHFANTGYLQQESTTGLPISTATVSPHFDITHLVADDIRKSSKKPHVKWQHFPQLQLDGHTSGPTSDIVGTLPMTPNGVAAMASKRDEGYISHLPARPPFNSHHSSSVPSTPHQHAREFTSRSRSPSPNGGLGSHSPRSVSSEANGALPALRKPRPICRYETNVAFGRRRIPYNIGSDMLEKAKEEPKAALNPEEEEKLSGDMRELYDRLLPSAESEQRRISLVRKLERILHEEWPAEEFKVHVFGSSGNLLCTSESDGRLRRSAKNGSSANPSSLVDVCIQTPMKRLETMHLLADALAKRSSSLLPRAQSTC